eukprot:TRINITY_DN6060_c0_g1_i1.p1 TRINITY_DN6060_c0_g1~~TRINITY_DN6060_c0_g1_i1.p1  ORF type:complete len:684 (-),score=134.00 TRINITY_DN6060_c0_g1_i1:88-2139(-)
MHFSRTSACYDHADLRFQTKRPSIGPIEHRIQVLLANEQHLQRLLGENFKKAWVEKQKQSNVPYVAKAHLDFDAAVTQVDNILERLQVHADRDIIQAWVADACRCSVRTLEEANMITCERLAIILEWVLRCLVENTVKQDPAAFYHRRFLVGFDYDTNFSSTYIQLSGAKAYSVFGNVWPHAIDHSVDMKKSTMMPRTDRRCNLIHLHRLQQETANISTVLSIPKGHCRLPPEILSHRLREMIQLDNIPHILRMTAAYEDFENIHLVYEQLRPPIISAIDKVLDDMHVGSIGEKNVRSFVYELLQMLKAAHSRGMAHGSLRLGACYLNDSTDMSQLQVVDFGLHELFYPARAMMPAAVLTPLDFDGSNPVPAYRRDFACVAEITYLMLGGGPICSLDFTKDEREAYFRQCCLSYTDHAFAKITHTAKDFIKDLLCPKKRDWLKRFAYDEAQTYMSHRWMQPDDLYQQMFDEAHGFEIMRRYDKWRSTLKQRGVVFKFFADNVALRDMPDFRDAMLPYLTSDGKVAWQCCFTWLQRHTPAMCNELVRKVSKAFGDDPGFPTITFNDFFECVVAWRRKRVREVLWQIFCTLKAYDGLIDAEDCREALSGGVAHIWSRPKSVLEVIFPASGHDNQMASLATNERGEKPIEAGSRKLLEGLGPRISFFDLAQRSDGCSRADLISCPP